MPSLSPGFTGWESQSQQISCWEAPSHPFSWLGHNSLAELNLFGQNPNSNNPFGGNGGFGASAGATHAPLGVGGSTSLKKLGLGV